MFDNKDVICFFGDSITANGMWMAEVYQTLRKSRKIKCYNCGVGGATAEKALKYIYSFCLVYNPNYVVVMFGMNDINYNLYSAECADEPDIKERQAKSIEDCKENYENVIRLITDFGAKPIICIPSPYDDVTCNEAEENLYCQCALDELEPYFVELSQKYGCTLVNFKAEMQPLLSKRNVMHEDRIHPTAEGHHIMAQTFLRDIGETDTCDFDTPFEFEDWNKQRYEAEQQLLNINFMEYCALLYDGWDKNKTVVEKKQLAKELYDRFDDKDSFFCQACLDYIKSIDLRDKLVGEVVRLTIF